jgi:hypothetical protein
MVEVSGQIHAPAALSAGKEPPIPFFNKPIVVSNIRMVVNE